jgi:hypothetical protein
VTALRRVPLRVAALTWFGVFGPPVAWLVQHIAGWSLTEAECGDLTRPAHGVHLHTSTAALGSAATLIAVAGGIAAVLAWRATRGLDDAAAPPRGRIHFLAVIGMAATPLFLAMILMSWVGVLFLQPCRQS